MMERERASFHSTRWSVVVRAASPRMPGAREALQELCDAYWWPLYAYARRAGLQADDAADAVQGLFADLFEKDRLAQADPDRGSFRAWLLSALRFHVSHERESARALKRGGGVAVVSLDPADAEVRWGLASLRELPPERVYARAWAMELLARALRRVEEDYAARGKQDWFCELQPVLTGGAHPDGLGAVARRLETTDGAARVAAHRLRRAFRAAIRAEVASTLEDPAELEDELRYLFAALSGELSPESP